MPELESLPGQQQVAFTLIQALDALRDGLRPFVIAVLQEKEGPQWFDHPRVQRMVPAPPALEGEAPYGPEGPALDLALLLKLIGSDCYWYRTFRPRLPGVSRWQIDSLRELRNRVAHNDGGDPLLTSAALSLPYLTTMEQLLSVTSSDHALVISQLRLRLQRSRRQAIRSLLLGRSRWSLLLWLTALALAGAAAWLIDYERSPRLTRNTIVIGTPDRRLERYIGLERHLEQRLRPAQLWRAISGEKIDVRIEGARSYPEAVSHLKARHWDVVLGFSPVVSMEAVNAGYRVIGHMFPNEPDYRSILFTRSGSPLKTIEDIKESTRIALGDFFSATKYYVPMSLLRGRTARVTINLPTDEIIAQVISGKADIGAIAGNQDRFYRLNKGLRILAISKSLPPSVLATSASLSDIDRIRLEQALLSVPAELRGTHSANYGPGTTPDYDSFERQITEGRVFSACLANNRELLTLDCSPNDPIDMIQGWIVEAYPIGPTVSISLLTADYRRISLTANRAILQQSANYSILSGLVGRQIRIIARRSSIESGTLQIETPHQLEILP